MNYREIKTDVLVIGGGVAGSLAAIEASKTTDDVMLVVKGLGGKSGNTPMAEGGIQASFHQSDTIDDHIKDTLDAGKYINNRELVRVMAEKAPGSFKKIEEYGVSFIENEDGTYFQYASSGSSRPRCLWIKGGGAGLSKPLFKTAKEVGVKFKEDFMVTKLLVSDDRVVGAIGLDCQKGMLTFIRAKSIVLATGGNERLYYFSDASVDSTGDGIALAYNAGAQVMDMEFMQFYPHALVYPDALRGVIIPEEVYYESLVKARIYNGQGEEFAYRYDPVRKEKTTRDILARAIFTEIDQGRGTEHGGIIIDGRGCDKKEIMGLVGPLYNFLLRNGVDMLEVPLEVAPSSHYQCGGIKIKADGSTNIKGLYAAGECTGGFDGANRLSSNALTEAVVYGMVSGQEAGRFSKDNDHLISDYNDIETACNEVYSILQGEEKEGVDVLGLKVKLQKLMVKKAGVVRNETQLKEALEEVHEMRKQFSNVSLVNKDLVCNQELVEALELKSLLDNAELLIRAALFRNESRGNHFRQDIPEVNDRDFKGSSCTSKGNGFELI
ncbi:fumarate reductase (CoM/CoB) subunit A [Dethiosulfatibacter aminovorans DSM 17477]|uniref:Fumarate reductase (CoM/CoB) subunit A n=1 Tax=Dethiosulfatibacter aminovorans DSM 17477 TaxID=1121476 RepID=A0A1M6HVQ7_9FIRM|nr:FAD-binding protein [Dethiosulfatibacter aminovorans]SHJ26177.1 fumarate reductase (CoM/CoB) subunit A [Dethiosulfatibacter aminovorans DSM 17477]